MSNYSYIYLIRGDNEDLNFTFVDNTDEDNPVPLSLVGATVFFTMKHLWDESTNDDNAVIQKDQSTHTDAVNGETTISLSQSDTNIEAKEYKADIQILDSDLKIKSSEEFRIIVQNDTTKRTS